MKALSFPFVCIALAACAQGGEQYQVRKLPSGREVRLVSVMPIRFQNGETSLMLTYQTPLRWETQSTSEQKFRIFGLRSGQMPRMLTYRVQSLAPWKCHRASF